MVTHTVIYLYRHGFVVCDRMWGDVTRAMTQTSHGLWPEKGRSERRGGVVHLSGAESPNKLWICAEWNNYEDTYTCTYIYIYIHWSFTLRHADVSFKASHRFPNRLANSAWTKYALYTDIYIYIIYTYCVHRVSWSLMYLERICSLPYHVFHGSRAWRSDSDLWPRLSGGHLAWFQHQIQSQDGQNDAGSRRRGVGLNSTVLLGWYGGS